MNTNTENTNINTTIAAKDIYNVYKKFQQTNVKVIKNNMQYACTDRYIRGNNKHPGNKDEFIETLGLTLYQYQSMINPSHHANVTFENFIKVCAILNLDIDSMLIDRCVEHKIRINKKWTQEMKRNFVDYLTTYGLIATSEKFGISEKTIRNYYYLFIEELGTYEMDYDLIKNLKVENVAEEEVNKTNVE
jgi:hypothetical protein